MKSTANIYIDLQGIEWDLDELDSHEMRMLADLQKRARALRETASDARQCWADFTNYRVEKIVALYQSRGLKGKQITRKLLHRIGQDISGRLGIALGIMRKPDYRSRLEKIIESGFKSRRDFCKATGLSEDMLSHVLAGRKDLSLSALTQALDRIDYEIMLVPRSAPKAKSA
jgi:hypothetical protein